MEQIIRLHCGAWLDRLPDCRWHPSMLAIVAFGLLVCQSNAVGGLTLAQLKALGWADNSTTATFSVITTAEMFLGALMGGIIDDKTGCRNAPILYEAIHIASMVVGAFSPNVDFLIACRFVMDVGPGALLVTLFTGSIEYVSERDRGTWSSRVSFIGNWSYLFCSLIAMGLMSLISTEWNRRVQPPIPAILSLIATALAWRYFPESPRRLESRGCYQGAERVMRGIEEGIICQTGKPLPPVVIADDGKAPQAVPYLALLTGVLLKHVVLGPCVLIAMNVVQYILVDWLPTIFMTQGTNLKDLIVLSTMSMFGVPFGIFTTILVMDKIPRKTMGMGLLISIAVLGYTYSLRTSMSLTALTGFFLITLVYTYVHYASVVYVPEIWPTEAKLRGSGLANAVGRINDIAAPYAVAVLLSSYGATGVFILLGTVSITIAIAIATIGIETKDVSVESLGIDAVASK